MLFNRDIAIINHIASFVLSTQDTRKQYCQMRAGDDKPVITVLTHSLFYEVGIPKIMPRLDKRIGKIRLARRIPYRHSGITAVPIPQDDIIRAPQILENTSIRIHIRTHP